MTALVRRESKTQAQHALQKDLFDLTTDDLKGFDVIVGAFGERTPETLSQHQIPSSTLQISFLVPVSTLSLSAAPAVSMWMAH